MLCKNPYVRNEHVTSRTALHTKQSRMAATPFGCGQCLPCRINKAREWTARLLLEQTQHERSCFVTLTYDDEHIPEELSKAELQQYLKRIRRLYNARAIRYLGVGEYGDNTGRPHYHLALFGVGAEDERKIKGAWNKCDPDIGIDIGDLSPESARYILGYCVKKLTKEEDPRLGGRAPEFLLSSKQQGGLGASAIKDLVHSLRGKIYFDAEKIKIIRELRIGGKKMPIGRYLTKKYIEYAGISDEKQQIELYMYQEELFNKVRKEDENYYKNLIDLDAQKRLKQEEKRKIFKSRRIL